MTSPDGAGIAGLLDRRLLIVTGKGGVGKTTLAAVLGLIAAGRGLDTVVVETGQDDGMASLLAEPGVVPPAGDGREPVPVGPHLYTLRIRPEETLTEYLEIQLHLRAMTGLVVRNAGFRRLLDAAPGWRELITLGKLWHLESQRVRGRPRWDLIVVDAPATGQGLSLLSVPAVVIDTVRLGPLRRHTDWVNELIRDPERTLVLAVTLLEELPVNETFDLLERVRELGLTPGPVIANGLDPVPDVPDLDALLAALPGLVELGSEAVLPAPAALRRIVESAIRRAERQRSFLAALRSRLGGPVAEVPYLTEAVEDRDGIARLARALEPAVAGWGPG